MASGQDDAETVWLQWSREHTGNWELKYDPEQRLSQSQTTTPPADGEASQNTGDPGSLIDQGLAASGRFTGEWRVTLPSGEEVYRFGGVGNSQGDANRVAAQWLRNNGYGVSDEGFEVLPVMR
jgi:hypothetical protein